MPQALPNERFGSAFYLCIILSHRCKPALFLPMLAATVQLLVGVVKFAIF
jgi:hypothetical protein